MSDVLFELADFEETAPPAKPAMPLLPCGRHTILQDDEHVAECWAHVCPSCGEHVGSGFLYRINHDAADRGVCGSIVLRLNHLTYALRRGEVPAARDLTVLDLGYRLGPDGAQFSPDGTVMGRWAS